MATSPTITPPPGYTLEQPIQAPSSGVTPPPGYTVEGQKPAAPQGPTIGPQPNVSNVDPSLLGGDSIINRLSMPLVKALVGIHDKLQQVQNLTQEGREQHPIQAKIGDLANSIEGLLTGNEEHPESGIGTGKYGLLTNPVSAALIPGAEGEPVLAGALRGGASLLKSGVAALRGGGEAAAVGEEAAKAPGIVKQVTQGEKVSQAPAQAAARGAAGIEEGQSLRAGIDVKKPLAEAKGLYGQVDNAAKTDFKSLYGKLDAAQDDAREAAIGSPEEAKAQLNIKNTQDAIDDAKKVAAQSGVENVDELLAKADAKFQETQANKDLNSKFFGNQGIIKGNLAHGAPESIDVNEALDVLENLDKPNKYGMSRLQQTSLGKDGAFKFKQVLYDAQKAGETAVSRQKLAKWIGGGGIAGAGTLYELLKGAK